jgi:hypothetical protein
MWLDGGKEWDEDRARAVEKGRRMTTHLQTNIVLVLTMLAIPGVEVPVRAGPSADTKAEAKKHYDRAMELNEDGQTAGAIVELKRAYEIAPHHTVLYNLGQAYITLEKPVEAVDALKRYLAEGGKAIKPARRAEVENEITRQKTRIATLMIRGLPDGALVTIDGDDIGKAPLPGPVRVGVGKHVVGATATGYESGETELDVAGEDNKVVELKLVAQPSPAAPAAAGADQATAPPTAPTPAVAASAEASTPPATPDLSSNSATTEQTAPGLNLVPAQAEVAASADASKARNLRIAGLVTGGVGMASLLAGSILWEAAKGKNDEAVSQLGTDSSRAHRTRSEAENLALGANVLLIAGGVLVGAGLLATVVSFDIDAPSKSVAIAPAVGPSFAGLTARRSW